MTIYFICPECGGVNPEVTSEVFNGDCESILSCYSGVVWVCPICKKQVEFGCAEVTNLMNK